MNSDIAVEDVEFLWLQCSESAAAAFSKGRYSDALAQWREAHALSHGFVAGDPRSACSLNNLGIGYRLKGVLGEAERIYRLAERFWRDASGWTANMQVQHRAKSSLFHLRMELKHRERYDRIAKLKYQEIRTAGRAGTLNNLAELCYLTGRRREAEKIYEEAFQYRIKAMGEAEAGVVVIRRNVLICFQRNIPGQEEENMVLPNDGDAHPFSLQALPKGWILEDPSRFTDEGRLMAAVLFTCLIDHTRFKHTRTDSFPV